MLKNEHVILQLHMHPTRTTDTVYYSNMANNGLWKIEMKFSHFRTESTWLCGNKKILDGFYNKPTHIRASFDKVFSCCESDTSDFCGSTFIFVYHRALFTPVDNVAREI